MMQRKSNTIKEGLLRSAAMLKQPSVSAAAEYSEKAELLAAEMNRQMSCHPGFEALIGCGNRTMMENNHRNHAAFFSSLLEAYNPETLVDTVLWVFRTYRAHGFRLAYWSIQLGLWVETLKRELSGGAFNEIIPFYSWMIENQPAFAALSDTNNQSAN